MTYGLDHGIDKLGLASAFFRQSENAATMIPNLARHRELSPWSSALVARDLRFMVGLPLHDGQGALVGSISVVASQRAVAGMGIPITLLKMLGNQFVRELS